MIRLSLLCVALLAACSGPNDPTPLDLTVGLDGSMTLEPGPTE